jgi:ABC-type transport system involved in cytochrome c biogenesis permease subunit
MSRAKAQQQPAVTGGMFLVLVGLGMAFLLFTAFLNVVKSSDPLFNESNLLFLALIFYAGAGALYMGYGVTGIERYVKVASIVTVLGFLANTAAAGHRWYVAGRPPFSNLYEMLLSFVWTLALLTIVAEQVYKVKIIGSVTMPLSVVSVILMQLMPSEVRPLVPALQSTWLHIHVSLAMLSYAACAVSFALSMMFLIQDKMKTETFQALTAAGMVGIWGSLMIRFNGGGLNVIAWDVANKQEVILERNQRLFVTIPDLGWLFALVLLSTIAPLALYFVARLRKDEAFDGHANRAMFITILLQVVGLAVFAMRVKSGVYPSANPDFPDPMPSALAASPFILAGVIGAIFAGLLYLLLLWRRSGLEAMLPEGDKLDKLTYKTVMIALPLLTAMIATGAYWANQTWGSYWSWDPKETWAAITWLVYAIYLHMRVTRGMRGRVAAYFAIAGFIVVIFTFFGVTYLLPSIHGYASM